MKINTIQSSKFNYNYNPFSGILDDDLEHTLVPRFNINEILSIIVDSNSKAIQFIGRQGRGKTTHLIYLQKVLKQYPIYLLNSKSRAKNILSTNAKVIFVDSIHHLSLVDRIKLLKKECTIVYTTHYSRKIECLIAKKSYSHMISMV